MTGETPQLLTVNELRRYGILAHVQRANDERVERLLATLSALASLLRSADQAFWADWITTARERIEMGDPEGLTNLLSAYGGMGSLNDLYLGNRDAEFCSLKEDAWSLARGLRNRT